MKHIQDTTISFRCPHKLKSHLVLYAELQDAHVSNVIREACTEHIRRFGTENRTQSKYPTNIFFKP